MFILGWLTKILLYKTYYKYKNKYRKKIILYLSYIDKKLIKLIILKFKKKFDTTDFVFLRIYQTNHLNFTLNYKNVL